WFRQRRRLRRLQLRLRLRQRRRRREPRRLHQRRRLRLLLAALRRGVLREEGVGAWGARRTRRRAEGATGRRASPFLKGEGVRDQVRAAPPPHSGHAAPGATGRRASSFSFPSTPRGARVLRVLTAAAGGRRPRSPSP